MRTIIAKLYFLIHVFPITLAICPQSTKTLRRIENTRYFIIQNTQKRGEFVTIEQARRDCSSHGLKLATIKDILSLAVVGRPLERMVFKERIKDTWYWLDAKYDERSQRYHWGDNPKDELKFTLILYRTPRPIGVSSHINYNNVYQKEEDKPQCLTLALPWLGSADHNETTTVFFGHQTSFDERDCKSQQKRHAICEGSKIDCQTTVSNPFVLDEDKSHYFDQGNWIFGDRKYLINWKQQTFNESEKYCKSLGLQLMNAGDLEKFLIPHIKMWSRAITAAQFWTGMSYNEESKQYMDSFGNTISDTDTNFTESSYTARSFKNSPNFCVALSQAYEFLSQMPCSNPRSPACTWSFIRYAPANCNNYHGTICQHADYDERAVTWYPKFKSNLDDVLEKTALTNEFGYVGNDYVLRSKYKQTFGLCYCLKGYRMVRSESNTNLRWSRKPVNSAGIEMYEYDYLESYWMVDKDLYNKDVNSTCTTSQYIAKDQRTFKDVKCTHWHFYLCEKLGRRPTKPLRITLNRAPPSEWREGAQPRKYPLTKENPFNCGDFHNNVCKCIERSDLCGFNTVTDQCVDRLTGCPKEMFNKKFCQRKGEHIYYAIQGLACNSQENNSLCDIEKQIYAANMDDRQYVDSRNITYKDWRTGFRDWKVLGGLWSAGRSVLIASGVPQGDKYLYNRFFAGQYQNIQPNHNINNSCSNLLFGPVGDGLYEISIKTGEMWWRDEEGNRTFSFRLNGLYIVKEFQQVKYRARSLGIELVVNFRVFQGGTMLELQGHPSKKIERVDQRLMFEACFSFCNQIIQTYIDRNYLMCAMSIIKYAG